MPPPPRIPPSASTSASIFHPCRTCGRHISPRRKWAAAPKLDEPPSQSISYCSHSCRVQRPRPASLDVRFEEGLKRALRPSESRPAGSVMVDEVERATVGAWRLEREGTQTTGEEKTAKADEGEEGSGALEEPKNTRERCRRAARRLAARGEVVLVGENGKAVVDGSYLKGRMGVRLP